MIEESHSRKPAAIQLVLGLLFGIVFGFLLQKGGVGKYHILIGQLLLVDWTVVKIMGTAVLVGMIGIFAMHAMGRVKLHLKPTRVAANIFGGLLFGAGFGLSAYCPGTNLVALGQGNWDALAVAAGLIAGSWLFAEMSGPLERGIGRWGAFGEKTLPELLHVPRGAFVVVFAIALAGALYALGLLTIR
jgi:uncharacterized membrane protein YedE/YeeE